MPDCHRFVRSTKRDADGTLLFTAACVMCGVNVKWEIPAYAAKRLIPKHEPWFWQRAMEEMRRGCLDWPVAQGELWRFTGPKFRVPRRRINFRVMSEVSHA